MVVLFHLDRASNSNSITGQVSAVLGTPASDNLPPYSISNYPFYICDAKQYHLPVFPREVCITVRSKAYCPWSKSAGLSCIKEMNTRYSVESTRKLNLHRHIEKLQNNSSSSKNVLNTSWSRSSQSVTSTSCPRWPQGRSPLLPIESWRQW